MLGLWCALLLWLWLHAVQCSKNLDFNAACDRSTYNHVPSNTSLPIPADSIEVIDSIIPSSSGLRRDDRIQEKLDKFLVYYREGLQKCENFLALDNENKQDNTFHPNDLFSDGKIYRGCRGRSMLRFATGVVLWPFGPIESCTTHSTCWFGLLHCGNFSASQLYNVLQSRKSGISAASSANLLWSFKSLHVDMWLQGPEILTPRARVIQLPSVYREGGAPIYRLPATTTDIIIADYTLTVSGKYRLQLDLQGFYPSVLTYADASLLGSYRNLLSKKSWEKQKSSARGKTNGKHVKKQFREKSYHISPSSRYELELVPSIFLGDCERRVDSGREQFCLEKCAEISQIKGSPFTIQSREGSSRCRNEENSLPQCVGGNHTGRFLQIPGRLIHICGAESYISMYRNEKIAQLGKRQNFDKYAAIEQLYINHANSLNIRKKMIQSYLDGDSELSPGYRRELGHYILNENFCLLVDITMLDAGGDTLPRADIFAPYGCRYHIYTKKDTSQCFKNKGYHRLLYHGDSMMRSIFGSFTRLFGTSTLSEEELKDMTNVKKQDEIYAEVGGVTILVKNTWSFQDDILTKTKLLPSPPHQFPDIYFANFAFAHSLSVELGTIENILKNHHKTVNFINASRHGKQLSHNTSGMSVMKVPRINIYQSASAMHGKRNPGFHWMSEVVRRQNFIMRNILVGQLGFLDFDEYMLTSAYFGKTNHRDGWHYNGVPMLNTVQVLMNMMCSYE